MRNNNLVETLIGALVVVIALGFVVFAYSNTNASGLSGYPVEARFSSADGIVPGTDVRLHGIKIGAVSAVDLDPKNYLAIVRMNIRGNIPVPDDSSIKVTSSGLLGNPYLSIQPGGSVKNLQAGGVIANTQGSVDIMGLIGRAIYGNTSSAGGGSSAAPSTAQTAPPPAAGHP
ncbi:MAG TPA: outer membrane lipid asymmetry maintenance protein MlaD [Rhizomicrobium sp.]|jgi:phospholipid/cholesterol/gamma-HCH transport system substrate-binding protein|nr:outer membrane lipid asymmetry maintenance protein MlaD [Rhizomicrobium sp.]